MCFDEWNVNKQLTKCKVMQVCFKRNPPCPPDMKIADKGLELVTETKLLGLTVQSDLRWDSQVNDMVCKRGADFTCLVVSSVLVYPLRTWYLCMLAMCALQLSMRLLCGMVASVNSKLIKLKEFKKERVT